MVDDAKSQLFPVFSVVLTCVKVCGLSEEQEKLQEGSDAAQQTDSQQACRPSASGSSTGR